MTTQSIIIKDEIMFLGIFERTSNSKEMDPSTAIIGKTIHKYFSENISSTFQNKKTPGLTYCIYTEYENDCNGEYTYFIGEEVTNFSGVETTADLKKLIISAQKYVKFTSESGLMPIVCIDLWKEIWSKDGTQLGGERSYIADFEVYDERAKDPSNTILDIYIGIK